MFKLYNKGTIKGKSFIIMCISISKGYSTTLLEDQINSRCFDLYAEPSCLRELTNTNKHECVVLVTQISTLVLSKVR